MQPWQQRKVTNGISGDEKLVIHSLVNHPYVKGFSDHSNVDHLNEQLLSGHPFFSGKGHISIQ